MNMKKILLFGTLAACMLSFACREKKAAQVVEKTQKPAQFAFLTPPDIHLRLKVENIGDVTIKGSMPDKTVFQIDREARAADATRAAELLDRLGVMPVMDKDGLIRFKPEFPETKAGEQIFSHLTVLVPLNQRVPVSVAMTGGRFQAAGMEGDLILKTSGSVDVALRAFQGVFDCDLDEGKAHFGSILQGGKIRMKKGSIEISQRLRDPMEDIVVELEEGEVVVDVQEGFSGRIRLEAPAVKNATKIQLASSSEGKGIWVRVRKGTAHLRSILY